MIPTTRMPQTISRARFEQLIKAFLLLNPEERMDREYHETYLLDGTRVTIFTEPMAKKGQASMIFRRYLIPQYIAEYGTLPNGYEESIRIPGYGFSYAFQPILPYMVQGYFMRLVKHFTTNADMLLYAARLVDFCFGLVMALFVLLLGRKWFRNPYLQYTFCFFVMFLPQSIFLHSYVNTDSCCMMSIAIILYGLTCGLEDHFTARSCVILSVGIIFCALSYYNAYGYILSSVLLFIAYHIQRKDQKTDIDWKNFFKKGISF